MDKLWLKSDLLFLRSSLDQGMSNLPRVLDPTMVDAFSLNVATWNSFPLFSNNCFAAAAVTIQTHSR
jgi:hypothetical protein